MVCCYVVVICGGFIVINSQEMQLKKGVPVMKRIKVVSIIGLAVVLLCLGRNSQSAILEVGPGKAYVGIGTAITSSVAGDTIRVFPGNYSETISISKSISLVSVYNQQAHIIGNISVSANNVLIDGFWISGWSGSLHGITRSSAGVGLQIKNNYIDGNGALTGSGSGIYSRNGTNVLIDNNTIVNCTKGININSAHSPDSSYGQGTIISNNRIHDNPNDGIDIHGEYISIYGNVIDNNIDTNWAANHPDGIQFIRSVVDGYSNTNHVRVYNNIFRNHTQNIFLEGYSDYPVTDVHIYNNVLYNDQTIVNGVDMVTLNSVHIKVKGTDMCNIFNNYFGYLKGAGQIIVSPQGTKASLGVSAPFNIVGGINIKNNIFYNPNTTSGNYSVYSTDAGVILPANMNNNLYYMPNMCFFKDGSSGTSYTTISSLRNVGFELSGVNANPMVANLPYPALRAGSPAIDKGASVGSLYGKDFNGLDKPQGLSPDIGPFEFRQINPRMPGNIQVH